MNYRDFLKDIKQADLELLAWYDEDSLKDMKIQFRTLNKALENGILIYVEKDDIYMSPKTYVDKYAINEDVQEPRTIELYHGTDIEFDTFENEYLSTKDSIDQYGSGFYFYSVKSKTVLHGGLRVYASVDINNSIAHDDKLVLSKIQIHSLLCACPDLEYRLLNFGDIDYEGFDNVLDNAVDAYYDNDFLGTLNMIGNDFFDGCVHLLLNEFTRQTGINCITDKERDICVILNRDQINITKVINEQDDE